MVGDVAALLNKQKTFALMNIPQQVAQQEKARA